MPLVQIRRIGCIHFDLTSIANPISTIRTAMAGSVDDFADALIVLPEAIDLGDKWGCAKAEETPVFIIDELETLSRELNVAFVVGLNCSDKPFNSAFLIDPQRSSRLSRKINDGSAGDGSGCMDYRGLTVASLICNDAINLKYAPHTDPSHRRVLECFKGAQAGNSTVLCVPDRMTTCSPRVVAETWAERLRDLNVVIANVKVKNDGWSGIRIANGEWKECQEGRCLQPLPSGGSLLVLPA